MDRDIESKLREIYAVLKKVTRLDWCLICDVKLSNQTDVLMHFLNVHQKGQFACNSFGCTHVADTNGDLRMHHLLWHSEMSSSTILLPVRLYDWPYHSEIEHTATFTDYFLFIS